MSRLHGRQDHNGCLVDWVMDCTLPGSFSAQLGASWFHGLGDCTLTLRGLDRDTAERVAVAVEYRCTISYVLHSFVTSSTELELGCIPLTGDEARAIATGASPVGVLLRRAEPAVWPELGYKLVAVPDPLLLLASQGKTSFREPAPERCQPGPATGAGSRPATGKDSYPNDHDPGARVPAATLSCWCSGYQGIRPSDTRCEEDGHECSGRLLRQLPGEQVVFV